MNLTDFHFIYLQTAIPILIGTKFDDFVRLPPDVQWTIVTQVNDYCQVEDLKKCLENIILFYFYCLICLVSTFSPSTLIGV